MKDTNPKKWFTSLTIVSIMAFSTIPIFIPQQADGINGTILHVGGSGEGNYTTIQSAIDNASNGDTVYVYRGTYHENVIVNKSIHLVGENKNITIIDGNKSANIVTILTDGVRLNSFTITAHSDGQSDIHPISPGTNNTFRGNVITQNNNSGIYICDSTSTIITGNTITNNTYYGITIDSSSNNNTIRGNTITHNNWYGVYLESSSNIITNNTITHTDDGISLKSSRNILVGNTLTNNGNGICLYINTPSPHSQGTITGNIIAGNTITNNNNGIYLYRDTSCPYCKDSTITSNVLAGNTIINNTYGISLSSSSNTTIMGNIMAHNTYGIHLSSSNNTTIMDNIVTNNSYALDFSSSNSNTITGNAIISNTNGIHSYHSSSNKIYHNNFINNSLHATTSPEGINTWDNGSLSGGNYWDTYTGLDANGDNIGDIPYVIQGENNSDRYPLMMPYTLTLNKPPICDLSASPTSGTLPLMVTFALTANDPDGYITTWALDINNDGTPDNMGSGVPPTIQQHTYITPGTYTVKLTVTDNQGATDMDTRIITVNQASPHNQAPTCLLTSNSTNGTVPFIVTFTMTASDPDGTIAAWTLDTNNDGVAEYSGSGIPPSTKQHIYETTGAYTAKLTVTDNKGATDSDTRIITVNQAPPQNQPPIANFDVSKENLKVTFQDTSTDPDGYITTWQWIFGDGTQSDLENPIHTYETWGLHNVTLTVTDNDGLTDTSTVSIVVWKQEKPSDDDDGGIPGFEFVPTMLSVLTLLVLVKRKKSQGKR